MKVNLPLILKICTCYSKTHSSARQCVFFFFSNYELNMCFFLTWVLFEISEAIVFMASFKEFEEKFEITCLI